jgi:hypothetical protein
VFIGYVCSIIWRCVCGVEVRGDYGGGWMLVLGGWFGVVVCV